MGVRTGVGKEYEFRKVDGIWQRRNGDDIWYELESVPITLIVMIRRENSTDKRKRTPDERMTTKYVFERPVS